MKTKAQHVLHLGLESRRLQSKKKLIYKELGICFYCFHCSDEPKKISNITLWALDNIWETYHTYGLQ